MSSQVKHNELINSLLDCILTPTHNQGVPGSSPGGTTILKLNYFDNKIVGFLSLPKRDKNLKLILKEPYRNNDRALVGLIYLNFHFILIYSPSKCPIQVGSSLQLLQFITNLIKLSF